MKVMQQFKEEGVQDVSISLFLDKRKMDSNMLQKTLAKVLAKNWILASGKGYSLTEIGEGEAKRVVRLHRLWELYLTQRLNFKEDHIHGTAETIEHLITDELEAELLHELDYPTEDPHNKEIPYD